MDKILQEIERIAGGYGVFQCIQCADAIQSFLMSQGVSAKRIKLDIGFRDLPWSIIYDLKQKEQIATNGIHEGIIVTISGQELVFDNIAHTGVEKAEWLSNLSSPTIEFERGTFEITEEAF